MGMYTGLRFRGYVKPEYRGLIHSIMEGRVDWADCITQFPFLKDFAELPRSRMIPFGALAYMPDEWEDWGNILTSSFKRQFDSETGYWAFSCSLKNYDDEINTFLVDVVCEICSSTDHIEYLYEEWNSSTLYELRDGRIPKIGEIEYHENDDSYDWRWDMDSN